MTMIFDEGGDLESALRLAEAFHAGSVWAEARFDRSAVADFLESLSANPDALCIVTAFGVVGGILTTLWFAPSEKLAVELFWYSERPGHGKDLQRRFEEWAREHGANSVQFSCQANEREDTLRAFFTRNGFSPVEVGFRKAI